MRRIKNLKVGPLTIGAKLLIMAAAGLIVVPQYAPRIVAPTFLGNIRPIIEEGHCSPPRAAACAFLERLSEPSNGGIARWLYDLLLTLSWGLLIVGAILVAVGLIRAYAVARR